MHVRGSLLSWSLILVGLALAASIGTGCSGDDAASPDSQPLPACVPGESYSYFRLPFVLEYRVAGSLAFSLTCDQTEGTLVLDGNHGILRAGTAYAGSGHQRPFPEDGRTFYTFTMNPVEVQATVCPQEQATFALSISAPEGSDRFAGALTVYCGTSTLQARPHQILRLSGTLEEAPPPAREETKG